MTTMTTMSSDETKRKLATVKPWPYHLAQALLIVGTLIAAGLLIDYLQRR